MSVLIYLLVGESEKKKEEKFTAREKEFLNKKKIRTAADLLVEK